MSTTHLPAPPFTGVPQPRTRSRIPTSRTSRRIVASLGILAAAGITASVANADSSAATAASCPAVSQPWPSGTPEVPRWPSDGELASIDVFAQPHSPAPWPTSTPSVAWPSDHPTLACL